MIGAARGLRLNTKLWKLMYKVYPSSYAEFRWKESNQITNAKMISQCLGVQAMSIEVKKLEQKPSSSHWRHRGQNKSANNFKLFNSEIEVKTIGGPEYFPERGVRLYQRQKAPKSA